MINLRILSGELLNQGECDSAERFVVSVFCLGLFAGYFAIKGLFIFIYLFKKRLLYVVITTKIKYVAGVGGILI